ncbi:MAG: ImmA/IrrE family metallo-endopeptidase, partial [Planctomycetales bacterium]|nr:ImmA/IrrE family metallo-endopeptidase [Planctomycetales bacterium]
DNFAGCLLMPRKLIYAAWAEFRSDDQAVAISELREQYSDLLAVDPFMYRGKIMTDTSDKENAIKEEFCRPLASRFQVSPEAMRIRLEKLELIVKEKSAMLF